MPATVSIRLPLDPTWDDLESAAWDLVRVAHCSSEPAARIAIAMCLLNPQLAADDVAQMLLALPAELEEQMVKHLIDKCLTAYTAVEMEVSRHASQN